VSGSQSVACCSLGTELLASNKDFGWSCSMPHGTLLAGNTVLCMKLLLWGWHAMVWLPPESLLTYLNRLWPQLWVKLYRAHSGYPHNSWIQYVTVADISVELLLTPALPLDRILIYSIYTYHHVVVTPLSLLVRIRDSLHAQDLTRTDPVACCYSCNI